MNYHTQSLETVIGEYKRICDNMERECILTAHSINETHTILRNAMEFWLEQGNTNTDEPFRVLAHDAHICAVLKAKLRNLSKCQ